MSGQARTDSDPQTPALVAGAKTEHVVRHVLHAIATGKWSEGQRLPSVRSAERLWSVNRLTVLKAYRQLAELGLVRNESRSGFYVAESPRVERVGRHRVELDRLYDSLSEQIRRETELSPLGTWRYLAQIAEIRAREQPECAFIECTRYEAEQYADEIRTRFAVPCLAMSTAQIGGKRRRIPAHVHTLVTTAFHRAEVQELAQPPTLAAVEVPVRFSPQLAEDLASSNSGIVLLGINREMLAQVEADLGQRPERASRSPIVVEVLISELDGVLQEHLPADALPDESPMVVLSPTLWEAATPAWKSHTRVRPLRYEICESAWPMLADALGLPLGAVR